MTPDQWLQIEDLYHAAKSERAALLECKDPEIRARVERMMELESGDRILDQSAADVFVGPSRSVLAPGTQLGPYEIEFRVGEGGMGTVYRARDTRLGRVVAVKIATARYSERFQLEARAISTINHPHVCTVYDVGPNYLVMEFIEGSTLAAEIGKGPLSFEAAARYGAQIAGALTEAHELGIVHRDLKPSNVMLTRHGVKVLDFGLASISSPATTPCDLSQTGAVMGTPAYMAPEQIEGQEPGSSADLFALGLILHEMSTGQLPFPGASLGQLLSSGRHATFLPPASHLLPPGQRAEIPSQFDGLIAKLLERDQSRRPQSASDVARELSALAGKQGGLPSASTPIRRWATVGAVCAFLAICGAAVYPTFRARPAAVKFTQLTDFTDSAIAPALSPDGRILAFIRGTGPIFSNDQIYVKLLPDGEARRLTDDERPKYNIAFSPDQSQIAYTVMEPQVFSTYTVSVLGGDSHLFLKNAAGLTWLDPRQLLYSRIRGSGVHLGVVTGTAAGENFRDLYFPPHERGMAHYSWASPDRKSALVVEMNETGAWAPCRIIALDGRYQARAIGPRGACESAGWSPDGSWMYFTATVQGQSHLWRQRFPNGEPEQITFGPTEEKGVAVDPDGRSVITSMGSQESAIWIHDAAGERSLSSEGEIVDCCSPPSFRADASGTEDKILYYLLRHGSDRRDPELWRMQLDSGKSEPVFPGVYMFAYDVSPDGRQVVYSAATDGGKRQLWLARIDRASPPRRIGSTGELLPHFGPKGQILFLLAEGKLNYLEQMNPDGSGRSKVVPYPFNTVNGISPGRHWVTGSASYAGILSVLAAPVDGGPPRFLCAIYCQPMWSSNGKYIYIPVEGETLTSPGRSLAIPLGPGESLPEFPQGGIKPLSDPSVMPGSQSVARARLVPGKDPSHFVYVKTTVHRNLYRISLP